MFLKALTVCQGFFVVKSCIGAIHEFARTQVRE